MFRREQRGGDAQGGTTDNGPDGEPGGEPGGEERASESGGGGWDSGEGSSRSDGVAVRAWLTPRFRRREWSVAEATAPSLEQAGEAYLLLRPVSSDSPAAAQPHAPTRTLVHGVMPWHGPQGSGPACRLPAAR